MKSSRKRPAPDRTGSNPIAADAVRAWESVQSRLVPIIGESGFRVLFARSLHRTRAEYPWLAREAAHESIPFSMLKASLEAQPPERATQGTRALMGHFNELLTALIGKDLVARLLPPPDTGDVTKTRLERDNA